jgi:hypothetical protein
VTKCDISSSLLLMGGGSISDVIVDAMGKIGSYNFGFLELQIWRTNCEQKWKIREGR